MGIEGRFWACNGWLTVRGGAGLCAKKVPFAKNWRARILVGGLCLGAPQRRKNTTGLSGVIQIGLAMGGLGLFDFPPLFLGGLTGAAEACAISCQLQRQLR